MKVWPMVEGFCSLVFFFNEVFESGGLGLMNTQRLGLPGIQGF